MATAPFNEGPTVGHQFDFDEGPSFNHQFDHQNVDLSDVVGTTGLPEANELVERLGSAFGSSLTSLTGPDQLFLLGEFSEPLLGWRHGSSSYPSPVSGFLSSLEASLPTSGLGDENVKIRGSRQSGSGKHIVVQQMVRQTEVVGARFQVHLDEDDLPFALTGRPLGDLPNRDPGARPNWPEHAVVAATRQSLGLAEDQPVEVELVVFPLEGQGVWAYEARCVLYDPIANIRAYLRADDLSLMLSFDASAAALSGEARVYPVNPFRTPDLETVRLDQIGQATPDRLDGSLVRVVPWTGASLSNASRDYRLAPTDPGFDEAHLFYHLQQAIRFFDAIVDVSTLRDPPFGPIKAHTGVPRLPETAKYVPDTGELFFGEWQSRSTSRSADVIYHELAHAVSDTIAHLTRWTINSPARGMSEGYSDYFAASALGDPRMGDYLADDPAGVRDASKTGLRFPPGYNGLEHALGEVWASVLWGVRGRCGASVGDKLAVESLYFLQQNGATFEEGCAALLTADRQVFPGPSGQGRHTDIIKEEFDRRRPSG